jgi:hypothetical protein
MKKIIAASVFMLFLVSGLKAQTEIKLPTFEGKDVVLMFMGGGWPYISASDGIAPSFVYEPKKSVPGFDRAFVLASCISQLRSQGFKLITSTSGSTGTVDQIMSYYIFQKD